MMRLLVLIGVPLSIVVVAIYFLITALLSGGLIGG